jgi:hypothetical protein
MSLSSYLSCSGLGVSIQQGSVLLNADRTDQVAAVFFMSKVPLDHGSCVHVCAGVC